MVNLRQKNRRWYAYDLSLLKKLTEILDHEIRKNLFQEEDNS